MFTDLQKDIPVQSRRFIILEDVGCFPFTFNTPPAYVLYSSWPIIIGLVSASYCSTCPRNCRGVSLIASRSPDHS